MNDSNETDYILGRFLQREMLLAQSQQDDILQGARDCSDKDCRPGNKNVKINILMGPQSKFLRHQEHGTRCFCGLNNGEPCFSLVSFSFFIFKTVLVDLDTTL